MTGFGLMVGIGVTEGVVVPEGACSGGEGEVIIAYIL